MVDAWEDGFEIDVRGEARSLRVDFADACAEDIGQGITAGAVGAAAGALVGGGIGLLIGGYGPWESVVDLGGPARSGDRNRVSVDVRPYPDGRIGLGVRLALGG